MLAAGGRHGFTITLAGCGKTTEAAFLVTEAPNPGSVPASAGEISAYRFLGEY